MHRPIANADKDCNSNKMSSVLETFVRPLIGAIAWDVKQGHGSFLTFNFGEPKLIVRERFSRTVRTGRTVTVRGDSHIWIECCHWRILDDNNQIAFSEDSCETIAKATAVLNGQRLVAIDVSNGKTWFYFDVEGLLETWPYEDDPRREQWTIFHGEECFSYRTDGLAHLGPSDTLPEDKAWQILT